MPIDEATIAFMKAYALRGVKDWNSKVPEATRKRARRLLGPSNIADKEWEVMNTIEAIRGGQRRQLFIPMPKVFHTGIEVCFFLPLREADDRAAFDLLLLCETDNCLGFRFEPAQLGTHDYGHVQMNRKMMRESVEVSGLPGWVPESYPAFPLRTSDPLEMFLSMATAVHGYRQGMSELLTDLLTEPLRRKAYLEAIERAML
jgi:hypothetical protein